MGRRRKGRPAWLKLLSPSHGGSPGERARRSAEAYFLQDGRPLVLVLDDIDRADRESALLIDALVAECSRRAAASIRGRGLALILTVSPENASRVPAASRLRLRPLRRETAQMLFTALLRPLEPPAPLVRAAIAAARGSPLRLRRLALAVREEWRGRRAIPPTAELPLEAMESPVCLDERRLSREERAVLGALAILGRPATASELAVATGLSSSRTAASLRRLAAFEATIESGRGAARTVQLASSTRSREIPGATGDRQARRIHERVVAYLEGKPHLRTAERDHLAGHLLALGRRSAGVRLALEAAAELRQQGSRDRALELLELSEAAARGKKLRFDILERMSELLDETGDHHRGAALLERFLRAERGRLEPRVHVRVLRRLGTHRHRGGQPAQALRVLESGRKIAGPTCDPEDLLLIESEIAELQIFQGNLQEAEAACTNGLQRLETLPESPELRGRMEVMLRASLGHIELRRLRFRRARTELQRALALGRGLGPVGDRSAILLNLGVVENEASDFAAARRCFKEAERILARVGASQDLIKVSTNLALTAAKLGDRADADLHLERAASLLGHFPVRRLECFAAYSRGLVRHIGGDCDEALAELKKAIALSRALGDRVMTCFAQIHAAESALLAGRHAAALSYLGAVKGPETVSLPVLARMTASRRFLLETLLGRQRRADAALRLWRGTPRSDVVYLETWNDFFAGLGILARGEDASLLLERCLEAFLGMRVPHGARLARLGLLAGAMGAQDLARIRGLAGQIEAEPRTSHRLLQVAEPLLLARARLVLDDVEQAEERLSAAGSAIVGQPYVELDWQIELLRVQVAIRRGDNAEARRHLHRAAHSRSLLLELVPAWSRQSFLAHARFAPLREAEVRLGLLPPREPSTERVRRSMGLDALVGGSAPMLELFRAIERLGGQDLPVVIGGETGTGKELVARAIHRRSARAERAFRVVHCASLPPELFESELFGHVAGAFTGRRAGPNRHPRGCGGGGRSSSMTSTSCQPRRRRNSWEWWTRGLSASWAASSQSRPTSDSLPPPASIYGRRRGSLGSSRRFSIAWPTSSCACLRSANGERTSPLLARHILEQHATRLDRPVSSLEPDAEAVLAEQPWPATFASWRRCSSGR
jgi:tetratricopeptide (TPR) repeat protein